VPSHLRPRLDEIVALTDAFAAEYLGAEYATLCADMAATLARKRPSPLARGDARSWAAAIVHEVGWVNFLTDPTQTPHMTTPELAARTGVGKHAIARQARIIRDALGIVQLDPAWTRPSQMLDNPLAWIVLVDGVAVDLRLAPLAIQEAAVRDGVIPFLPPPAPIASPFDAPFALPFNSPFAVPPGPPSGSGSRPPAPDPLFAEIFAEVDALLGATFATNPSATLDDLNAALAAMMAGHNERPQADLGGLAPTDVQRLLAADWESEASAIRLDGTLALEDLAGAPALHDARALLAMLAERGTVKATPKGNLPRAFVRAFLERTGGEVDAARVQNEEDVFSLHISRVLLDVAGLVKRRTGIISRTRRGEQLTADDRAGALYSALVHAQFKRLDLAYLDMMDDAPGFQQTIGFTLYQFGRMGSEWQTADELVDQLLLPAVRDTLPVSQYFDMGVFMLKTRFLRPLAWFGLAEARETPRSPDEVLPRTTYRKTPLFDQFITFRVAAGG